MPFGHQIKILPTESSDECHQYGDPISDIINNTFSCPSQSQGMTEWGAKIRDTSLEELREYLAEEEDGKAVKR